MELNRIIEGNCFDSIKELPDNFIDLVVTSPPYADIKSYGKKVNVLHPDNYVDWILPLHREIQRVLKPSGSYILNINDKIIKKQRHPYCFDLVTRTIRETELKFYDRYFWYKTGGYLPNCGKVRLNNLTEYLFHFVKDVNLRKIDIDNVREPYADSTGKKYNVSHYGADDKGKRITLSKAKSKRNPLGKIPSNVFNFPTSAIIKDNKHPAPFHPDLPKWFIKALTDEGDLVLDVFMGSGSTAIAAIEMKRNWLGFELNSEYIKLAYERISKIEPIPGQKPEEKKFNFFFGGK